MRPVGGASALMGWFTTQFVPDADVTPKGTTFPSSETEVMLSGVSVRDCAIGTGKVPFVSSVEPVFDPRVRVPSGTLITPPCTITGAKTAREPPTDNGVAPLFESEARANVMDARSVGSAG